jgi:hypothetical protein
MHRRVTACNQAHTTPEWGRRGEDDKILSAKNRAIGTDRLNGGDSNGEWREFCHVPTGWTARASGIRPELLGGSAVEARTVRCNSAKTTR